MGARVKSPSSGARPGARALNLELPTSLGSAGISISLPAFVALLLGGLLLNLTFSNSAYAAFSASISRSGTVSIAEAGQDSIRPTSTGTLGTGSDRVSVTTNCTYGGYKLYVSATSTGGTALKLADESDSIPTSATATGSEKALSKDTWGVGKTASAFSGLPAYTADAGTLTAFYTGTSSSSYDFYYGVNVSTAKTPGTYTGEVLYTVLMDEACTKYTLNFDGNSATTNTLTPQELDFDSTINLADISSSSKIARTGYTLTGWKDQNNNSYGITGTADVNPSDAASVTLTAQWQINSNNVTVNKGTNVTTISGTGSYDYNSTVTISATAFATGYHFSGWTVNSGGATLYSNSAMTTQSTTATPAYFRMPDNAVTVTANAAANTYTIAYNNGGGSGTAPSSQSGTYGSSITTRANSFSRTGYQFVGWSTTNGASSATCNASASCSVSTLASNAGVTGTNGATINLYAVWTPNTLSITYSANGGTGSASKTSETAKYGTNVTMPTQNTLAKSGYTFQGWSLSSSATSATWTGGQGSIDPTSINSSLSSNTNLSTTVYAVWKASGAADCSSTVHPGTTATSGCKLKDGNTWVFGNSNGTVTWNNLCTASNNCKSSTYCPSSDYSIPTKAMYDTLVSSYSGGELYTALGLSSDRYFWSSTQYYSTNAYYLYVDSSSAYVYYGTKTRSYYVLCYKSS